MPSVEKLVLRYVVPFSFSGSYQKMFLRMKENKVWKICSLPIKKPAVFFHLYQLAYSSEESNHIGCTWEFEHRNKLPQLRYKESEEAAESKWHIRQVQIHLFHTNVGLLWYELEPLEAAPDPDSLILMQNRFKECSYTDDYFTVFHRGSSKDDPGSYGAFNAAKWLAGLLNPLGRITYLNGSCKKQDEICPDRALIFNYVLLESPKTVPYGQLQTYAFRLANGYNEKYLPSPQALAQSIQPFEDVCMYACRGGCGYYAVVNEENKRFFAGNFDESIRKEYFFLYILTLYQSYSLLHFSMRCASEFTADPLAYNREDLGGQLDVFVAELNAFLMKGMHSSVSSVQHHNDFYQYLRTRMMIQEDIESLKIGTEALAQIQHARREHEERLLREAEDAKERARDRRQNIALAILSLFSLFAVFMDLNTLIDTLFSTDIKLVLQQLLNGDIQVIAQLAIHVFVLAIAIVCVSLLVSSFRTNHKEKPARKS